MQLTLVRAELDMLS